MKLLVVFFTLAAVARASLVPLAQPAHHPALLLDPHGRPLDTADVINARAIHLQAKALEPHGAAFVTHAAVAPVIAPAAVSHQSRVDVRTSPAIVTAHAAPVLAAHSAYATPLLGHSTLGFAGHGHLLKKRSLGHIAYAAPVVAPVIAAAPSAVSHQSRVDVRTSPSIVTAHTAPVLSAHSVYTAPLLGHSALGFAGHGHLLKKRSLGHIAYAAPVVAPVIAAAPAAVSHQSRVDVRTSPAIVTAHTAPVLSAHSVYTAPLLGHSALGFAGHGHLLKKRSLGHIAYTAPVVAHAPAAVSHQSRVDVISSPAVVSHAIAAPAVTHAVVAPVVGHAVTHQSRVDVHTSPAVVSHSIVAAPILGAHSSLALSGHGHLLKKRSLGHIISPIAYASSALSHQSRVDVVSRPAVVSHAVVAPVVAHAAPSVLAAPVVPLAHSTSYLHHTAPLVHAARW